MKTILNKLMNHSALSSSEANDLLYKITRENANQAQIVAAITCIMQRNISINELNGFRNSLLNQAVKIDLDGSEAIDVCGTGGDSKNTFNISTLAAIVIAGANYKVVKHGNYGVSSMCGSSTVLEGLGYNFTARETNLKKQVNENGLCFLHAPLFHPCLKKVGQIRKDLGVRTFFNFLGPLVNPIQPAYQLTGVYNLNIGRLYKNILSQNRKEFKIIHSLDGYDEVSLTGPFKLFEKTSEVVVYPDEINQETVLPDNLFGGNSVKEAQDIFISILNGSCTKIQKNVVLTNAAYGIQCFKPHQSFSDCFAEAETSLDSKSALTKFKNSLSISQLIN